jgi:hypothetical protein
VDLNGRDVKRVQQKVARSTTVAAHRLHDQELKKSIIYLVEFSIQETVSV